MANVLLGVCGGIAAYKSCEIVRLLKKAGHDVQVVMTESAQKFIAPLTFEALSGNPVHTDMFHDHARGTAHISLARWADTFLIAPATAETLAKLANGHADDFISTLFLAASSPCWIAPAMNTTMWHHPHVQDNLQKLARLGVHVIPPEEGDLACGEHGEGKLASPEVIVAGILGSTSDSPLWRKKIVVTAGATREYLDPVRFISSPSSGKMGSFIAQEAALRGADVTLIHGHLTTPALPNVKRVHAESADEMFEAAMSALPCDVFVACAAVADYKPKQPLETKSKKTDSVLNAEFVPTRDIAAEIGRKKRPSDLLVGFAAESDQLVAHARKKFEEKNMDLIVANQVYKDRLGFSQDQTSIVLITKHTETRFADIPKSRAAKVILDAIESLVLTRVGRP